MHGGYCHIISDLLEKAVLYKVIFSWPGQCHARLRLLIFKPKLDIPVGGDPLSSLSHLPCNAPQKGGGTGHSPDRAFSPKKPFNSPKHQKVYK